MNDKSKLEPAYALTMTKAELMLLTELVSKAAVGAVDARNLANLYDKVTALAQS